MDFSCEFQSVKLPFMNLLLSDLVGNETMSVMEIRYESIEFEFSFNSPFLRDVSFGENDAGIDFNLRRTRIVIRVVSRPYS